MPGEFRKRELIDDVLVVTHLVDDNHEGWRADRFLKAHYKHFSRNKLQQMIDLGRINMPGRPLKPSTRLHRGEQIRVTTRVAQTDEPAVSLDYRVLFEDDHVLVIDKPGNLPVHPAGRFLFNTLLMALRRDRADWLSAPERDFYLIHRLDRETSGVLLLAKSSAMAGELVRQFRERRTEKRYWAIVQGHPPEERFTVDADLGPDRNSHIRLKMAGYPKGQGELDALTHFQVLKRGTHMDLVDCELKTGRQHQIRVHLSYAGFPVVGDKLYGSGDAFFLDYLHNRKLGPESLSQLKIDRQALHSRYLRFYHAPKGKWLEVESPLPPEMERLLHA